MPLQIVRDDITKMEVDAIVSAANERLMGGGGVDGMIHRAAGPGLLRECMTLGGCQTGSAKITAGYDLPSRWVIHAVGPVWQGGKSGERDLLASCCRRALELAVHAGCKTVAMPLISAGTYGFPKAESLRVLTNTISEFLFEHDMQVYIVVFEKEALLAGSKLFAGIREYIDDHYVDEHAGRRRRLFPEWLRRGSARSDAAEDFSGELRWTGSADEERSAPEKPGSAPQRPESAGGAQPEREKMGSASQRPESAGGARPEREKPGSASQRPECAEEELSAQIKRPMDSADEPLSITCRYAPKPVKDDGSAADEPDVSVKEALPDADSIARAELWDDLQISEAPFLPGQRLDELLERVDESFSQMLLRKIDERGMKDSECYKKANIDRRLFSKIRKNVQYHPDKPTVLAFAVALELSLADTREMLMKAGFALSRSSKADIIVEYFIAHGEYDIHQINAALFDFDQAPLGGVQA